MVRNSPSRTPRVKSSSATSLLFPRLRSYSTEMFRASTATPAPPPLSPTPPPPPPPPPLSPPTHPAASGRLERPVHHSEGGDALGRPDLDLGPAAYGQGELLELLAEHVRR